MSDPRRGRNAFLLATAAIAWGALGVAAGFLLPVYSVSVEAGEEIGATFVAIDGGVAVVWLCAPLAVAVAGWLGLRAYCQAGRRSGKLLATWLGGIMTALGGVALLVSVIGPLLIPPGVLLLAASSMTPHPDDP